MLELFLLLRQQMTIKPFLNQPLHIGISDRKIHFLNEQNYLIKKKKSALSSV